jgi:hypothetical protein
VQGEGDKASCTVTFFNAVTLPGTDDFTYTRMTINVSKVLPQGDYILSVNGKAIAVRYRTGHWLAGSAL